MPDEPGAYQHALVSTNEAAQILGVTPGRWRQVTGARQGPAHPVIGPGMIEPGVRGARWPLRNVLTYAMGEGKRIPYTIPPLLPGPADYRDGLRYRPLSKQVSGAPDATELRVPQAQGPDSTVWAQMFAPLSYDLCGQEQPLLLLLTPLWPSGNLDVDVMACVEQAMLVSKWSWALPTTSAAIALAVAVIPVQSELNLSDYYDIKVHEITPSMLEPLLDPDPDHFTSARRTHLAGRFCDYILPAVDVATCLGWPGLPWWPRGTASRTTCAQWRPDKPAITIPYPASHADRALAMKWLQHQPALHTSERADYLDLIEKTRPGALGLTDIAPAPEGFQQAVTIEWPPTVKTLPGGSWPRALDTLLDDATTPAAVGKALMERFGDPAYTRPAHIKLDELPADWREAITAAADKQPYDTAATSPRWRPLEELHAAKSLGTPGLLRRAVLGPLDAPAMIDDESITWLAPTGYVRQPDADITPALALPAAPGDPLHEALLVRDDSHQLRGWVRTADNTIAPLPGKAGWDIGDHGQAMVLLAALTHRTTEEAYRVHTEALDLAIQAGHKPSEETAELETLIANVTPGLPLPIDWDQLIKKAGYPRG